MIDVVTRHKTQPPPQRVVWEELTHPNGRRGREWLVLREGEKMPRVLDAQQYASVVWSSLWIKYPKCRIRFDLSPAGGETLLQWTLQAPNRTTVELPADWMRRRINYLINAEMRYSFGQ